MHHPVGQERAEADVARGRDLARVVVLDDCTAAVACRRRTRGELAGAGRTSCSRPVGLCARGCRTTTRAPPSSARGERVGTHAVPVERDRHALEPELVEQVEQRREAGVLDGDAVAEAGDLLEACG